MRLELPAGGSAITALTTAVESRGGAVTALDLRRGSPIGGDVVRLLEAA